MRKIITALLLGILLGAGGYWYLTQPGAKQTVVDAGDAVRTNVVNITHSVQETIDTDKIKEELARTGKVIREKARQAGESIADATADARITAAVKAKLLADPNLSALKINVDTTEGVVTLSGTVSSHDEIARAVERALATDGVQKVVSTLQVKPS